MESRTSPGKSGSVQPLSEYREDAFCRFSWGCRCVGAVVGGSPVAATSRSRSVFLWSVPSHLVYSWGVLALVLCHSSYGKGFAAKRVGQESGPRFHLAPSLFLRRLNNACLKPTHVVADGLPINVMPVSHAVEGCTSSVLVCRHLLFLLCRLVKCSCHERPRGSLPACA